MEKAYKNIALFFIIITIIVFVGFFNTYLVYFPDFENFQTFHHVHGILMVLWLATLIVQPILINQKKFHWHRTIGKISYVLVPIMVISMLVAYQHSFYTSVAKNGVAHTESLSTLFMPLADVLPFSILYILAIMNIKKIGSHLRYMTSTAVIVVSAGLLRLIMLGFGLSFLESLYASVLAMALIFIGLIVYDLKNKMLSKNKSFVIALVIFSIPNILMVIVPFTSWWLKVAESLAK